MCAVASLSRQPHPQCSINLYTCLLNRYLQQLQMFRPYICKKLISRCPITEWCSGRRQKKRAMQFYLIISISIIKFSGSYDLLIPKSRYLVILIIRVYFNISDEIVNILDTNILHMTYWFRNSTHLFILSENAYLRFA